MEVNVSSPEFMQPFAADPKQLSEFRMERGTAVWVTRKFGASADRVFDAWVDPRVAGRWLFATAGRPMAHVRIDARVGGSFRFVDYSNAEDVEHTGVYTEIARPWRLAFMLSAGTQQQAMTRVAVEIVPIAGRKPARCEVIVTHEGVPADYTSRIESRWTGMLYGLGMILDAQFDRNAAFSRKNGRFRRAPQRVSAPASRAV